MIRDRLVLGIADLAVQEKLLIITDLKLEKALEICRATEILKERVQTMHEEKVIGKVNRKQMSMTKTKKLYVKKSQESKEESKADKEFQCRRCNRKHRPRECPAYGKKCNRCGKLNHFKSACRVKGVQQIEDQEVRLVIEIVNTVKGSDHQVCASAWYKNVKIDNKIIKFKLDTGAQVNILPDKVSDSLKNICLEKTNIILEAYGGHKFKPICKVKLHCKVKDCVKIQELIVVRN